MEIKNLQIFADNPTVNVTTDAGLSAENKTFYDRALVEEAGPNLIHGQFGQKRPIPKNGGKRIQFRRYASLPKALKPLTEGVTPEGRKLSATAVEAEVNQYGDFVCLSDVLDLTAIDNNVLEATKAVGRQAGLTLDTITRNVLQSGTNVFYCPKIGDNGVQTPVTDRSGLDKTCTLTVDVVKKVAAMLKAANAPKIDGDYVCILHPYVAYDIMSDPRWEEMHKYATPENMYEGEIGRIAGVRFVETSEAAVYKGTENDCPANLAVFGCLFLAQGAYGVTEVTGGGLQTIIKQLGSAGTADPLDQRSTVGWKALQTAEILMEPYMVRVECCSAFSPSAEAN
uniref:Major capsid protein n=1 Tax=Podoviridae sp. ctgFL11 TaxID=2827744 RepID=A0A8S5SX31_9CAUD|nr:MAG TPA: major capsid protein [Podoviridae sp. ctgFL11]